MKKFFIWATTNTFSPAVVVVTTMVVLAVRDGIYFTAVFIYIAGSFGVYVFKRIADNQ